MKGMQARQVIIVGLDGTRLDTLQYLSRQGHMPNVHKIFSAGTFGHLRSVLPPYSAPAWVSMTTGTNPGKHGIYDFYLPDPKMGRRVPVNATHVSAKTLWELLGDAGHRVAVINVPITYPPQPVKGVLVSDFLITPEGQTDYAYPQEVRDGIERLLPDFHPAPFRSPSRTLSFVQQVIEWTEKAEQVCQWIGENHAATFFMNVFQATDVIQHYFFDCLQPARLEDEKDPLSAALLHLYRRLDDFIGDRLQRVDGGTALLLVSDHGFTALKRSFYLNRWLQEQGWLALRRPLLHQRLLARLGLSQRQLLRWLQRLDLLGLADRLPLKTRRQMGARLDHAMGGEIDWERTLAYASAISSQAIYVKEEAAGTPDGLLSELMARLGDVRDPDTGQRVLAGIYRREELYSGPHLQDAPHLVHEPTPGCMVDDKVSVGSTFGDVLPSAGTGQHHPDGFYALFSPGRVSSARQIDATIVDIAPTILYLMGEPVPRSMDGRVLEGAFEPGYLADRSIRYTETSHLVTDRGQDVYSEEEMEVISRRLKDLGYLS
jgi:predicted AlkP superfamily phosphohydrolase/phosphomutase